MANFIDYLDDHWKGQCGEIVSEAKAMIIAGELIGNDFIKSLFKFFHEKGFLTQKQLGALERSIAFGQKVGNK